METDPGDGLLLLLLCHRVHQLRQRLDVSLCHQQGLYLAHFLQERKMLFDARLEKMTNLFCVDIWNDFAKSLKGVVESVHPLSLPRVGHVAPVLHNGGGGWVQVLLSPSLSFLLSSSQ